MNHLASLKNILTPFYSTLNMNCSTTDNLHIQKGLQLKLSLYGEKSNSKTMSRFHILVEQDIST